MSELDAKAVAHRDHRRDVDGAAPADRVGNLRDLAKDLIAREAFGALLLGPLLLVVLSAQLCPEMLDFSCRVKSAIDEEIFFGSYEVRMLASKRQYC